MLFDFGICSPRYIQVFLRRFLCLLLKRMQHVHCMFKLHYVDNPEFIRFVNAYLYRTRSDTLHWFPVRRLLPSLYLTQLIASLPNSAFRKLKQSPVTVAQPPDFFSLAHYSKFSMPAGPSASSIEPSLSTQLAFCWHTPSGVSPFHFFTALHGTQVPRGHQSHGRLSLSPETCLVNQSSAAS